MDADDPNEDVVFVFLPTVDNIAIGKAWTESMIFGVHLRSSAVNLHLPFQT